MSARKVDPSLMRAARKLCQLDGNRWSEGVAGVYLRHARAILRAAGRYVSFSPCSKCKAIQNCEKLENLLAAALAAQPAPEKPAKPAGG